jgi:hypothetical protein
MKTQTKPIKSTHRHNQIQKLVERGYALHQQVSTLNEELKTIKDLLKVEAIARPTEHVPLIEKGSEGEQWIATAQGCECRIVFPGAKLKTELDPSQPDFLTVKSLAGPHFKALFRKVTSFEPVEKEKFRGQVTNLLTPMAASQLLELCSTPTEPKAVWKERAARQE